MIGTRRLKSPASTRSWQTDRWFITTDEWNGAVCRNGKNLHWRAAQRNIVTRQSLLRYGFVTVYTATFSCQCRIAVHGFALLRPVIGPENSWHPLNQSNAKPKTITTWSPAFSRALGSLLVFTLSSHWLLVTFSFALIGCCDNFGLRRSVEMRC